MLRHPLQHLILLAFLALSACELPSTPRELGAQVTRALMEGNDEALQPLLAPSAKASGLSARKTRIRHQGLVFRTEELSPGTTTREGGIERSLLDFQVAISGTDRFTSAGHMVVACATEPRRLCQLEALEENPWSLPELTSVATDLAIPPTDDPAPRVWLLTSLDVLDPRLNLFTARNAQILSRAEELFGDWATSQSITDSLGARLRIAHLVDQHQLAQVLVDPRTRAVFWVSHGDQGKIIDSNGFELAPVFKDLTPRSRALRIALVSCNSQGLLVGADGPDPRVVDFDRKIDLLSALEEALKKTPREALDATPASPDQQAEPTLGETLSLVRHRGMSNAAIQPALRVEIEGRIAATLPSLHSAQQSLELRVPITAQRILLTAGESYTTPLTEIDLGDFEILSPGWKFFSDASGRPIGVTRRILQRNGK